MKATKREETVVTGVTLDMSLEDARALLVLSMYEITIPKAVENAGGCTHVSKDELKVALDHTRSALSNIVDVDEIL